MIQTQQMKSKTQQKMANFSTAPTINSSCLVGINPLFTELDVKTSISCRSCGKTSQDVFGKFYFVSVKLGDV